LAPSPTIITRASGTSYAAATARTAPPLSTPAAVMLRNSVSGMTGDVDAATVIPGCASAWIARPRPGS
jgi:hypothetical protein